MRSFSTDLREANAPGICQLWQPSSGVSELSIKQFPAVRTVKMRELPSLPPYNVTIFQNPVGRHAADDLPIEAAADESTMVIAHSLSNPSI